MARTDRLEGLSARARAVAAAMTLLAATACDPRPPPAAPPPRDDVAGDEDLDAAPTIAVAGVQLPPLPIEVEPDHPQLEAGWGLAERSLRARAPRAPNGEAWEIQSWAETELVGWMSRRVQEVGDVQRALEGARSGADDGVSVVANFLLGVVYSRFALDLRGVEAPESWAGDARGAEFRAAMARAAAPVFARAVDAFGACSIVAGGAVAHTLARWRERCDQELAAFDRMLPGADIEATSATP